MRIVENSHQIDVLTRASFKPHKSKLTPEKVALIMRHKEDSPGISDASLADLADCPLGQVQKLFKRAV